MGRGSRIFQAGLLPLMGWIDKPLHGMLQTTSPFTAAPPPQWCSPADSNRLVRQREHFSRSVMVSVAVSKVSKIAVMFVDTPAKVHSDS